jgi:hypothetical protein
MSYAYSYETNSVSKWDTIQADVADAYTYLDEVDVVDEELDDLDVELTDEQVDAYLAEMWEVA